MLLILELITAILGILLFYREIVKNRFVNYATSIFVLAFVPLLCVYPVIARLAVGGAYTIESGTDYVIADPWAYVAYQAFCLTILLTALATVPHKLVERPFRGWRDKYRSDPLELVTMIAIVAMSLILYVYSTGLSPGELLVASRFEWFDSSSYSSSMFVISTYLLALSPVALLLALQEKKHWLYAFAILALLVFYGLLAKDRKWAVYILSAGFAYLYIKNGYLIHIRKKVVIIVTIIIAILSLWQIVRGVLFSYVLTGVGDPLYDSQQLALRLLTRGDVPYYYNASVTAIDMNLNDDFLIPFAVLRRQLFFFLPADFSFGLKVEDISALFSDAIGAGDAIRRGNMPPGFFGLFVISFGWLGTLLSCALVTVALRALDRFIHRNRGIGAIVVMAHLLSSVTLLLRGDDSSATYFIVSSLALLFALRLLFRPGQVAVRAPG